MRTWSLVLATVGAFLLLAPGSSVAWNNTGHRIIAVVAYRDLDAATRTRVAALLREHPASPILWKMHPHDGPDPALNLFMNASLFPDEARRGGPFERYNRPPAHYVNYRIMAERGNEILDPLPGENILNSFVANVRTIEGGKGPAADRAVALSWIFHQVGDLHQPLHAVARYSSHFPYGDRGGNEVGFPSPNPIASPNFRRNLHAYWDGLLGMDERPESVEARAQELMAAHPRTEFADELTRKDIADWARASAELAVRQVYRDLDPTFRTFREAPIGYEADARRTAQDRAGLAGYRLADQLRSLFPAGSAPPISAPVAVPAGSDRGRGPGQR